MAVPQNPVNTEIAYKEIFKLVNMKAANGPFKVPSSPYFSVPLNSEKMNAFHLSLEFS